MTPSLKKAIDRFIGVYEEELKTEEEKPAVSEAFIGYCYTDTGEDFWGDFPTIEAVQEEVARIMPDSKTIWIGERRKVEPELLWSAFDWLEQVRRSEDFNYDLGPLRRCSEKQQNQLDIEVRRLIVRWMNKNGIRPEFTVVKNIEVFTQLPGGKFELEKSYYGNTAGKIE